MTVEVRTKFDRPTPPAEQHACFQLPEAGGVAANEDEGCEAWLYGFGGCNCALDKRVIECDVLQAVVLHYCEVVYRSGGV